MLNDLAKTRKEQIALTAIDLISECGIQNLSMAKIAERIGVTDAALYKHFKTKNEMLLYMVDLLEEILIGKMTSHSDDIKVNHPLERLKNILTFQFTFVEENKGIPRILFSEALQFNDNLLKTKTAKILNKYLSLIKKSLNEAKDLGIIKLNIDIESVSFLFMGMVQSTVILWLLGGCKMSLTKKKQALWEGFVQLVS